jgi:hypothetical protein
MLEFLLADGNAPFAVALGVVLVLGAVEILTALFGVGLSSLVDSVLPDFDGADIAGPEVDADVDADLEAGAADADGAAGASHGPVAGVFSWLCLGKVPALILLIAFLAAFGLAGTLIQALTAAASGATLPGWFAAIPALAVALPATRFFGLGFARVMPKEETYAVSDQSFVGRVAVVTLGTAAADRPAEAKVKDEHGRTHYVRVAPADPAQSFPAGTTVLLRAKDGAVFRAVAAPAASR